MSKLISIVVLSVLSSACSKEPPAPEDSVPFQPLSLNSESAATDRFEVRLVQRVSDKLAYGQQRGVYLIVDRTTGREFVGVSGVGIADLGVHTEQRSTGNGKTEDVKVPDER
jgi:hypothetical protein